MSLASPIYANNLFISQADAQEVWHYPFFIQLARALVLWVLIPRSKMFITVGDEFTCFYQVLNMFVPLLFFFLFDEYFPARDFSHLRFFPLRLLCFNGASIFARQGGELLLFADKSGRALLK